MWIIFTQEIHPILHSKLQYIIIFLLKNIGILHYLFHSILNLAIIFYLLLHVENILKFSIETKAFIFKKNLSEIYRNR